eukprot:COSAG04_NODE_171_length_21611_cov_4.302808_15_plen_35_part_01
MLEYGTESLERSRSRSPIAAFVGASACADHDDGAE